MLKVSFNGFGVDSVELSEDDKKIRTNARIRYYLMLGLVIILYFLQQSHSISNLAANSTMSFAFLVFGAVFAYEGIIKKEVFGKTTVLRGKTAIAFGIFYLVIAIYALSYLIKLYL